MQSDSEPHSTRGNLFLNLAETAFELKLSEARFRRVWPQLVEKHGFPAPLPGLQRRLWSRAAVLQWGARQSPIDQLRPGRNALRSQYGLPPDQ